MKDRILENWEEIMEFLRTQYGITKISYDTWLSNLRCKDVVGNKVTIISDDSSLGPNISFIYNRYGKYIKNAIEEVMESEEPFEIEIVCQSADTPAKASMEPAYTEARNMGMKLYPDYTFDNFVVSSNNSIAHAACLSVAEAPGEYYNPLYIYGDPGLGKTHLMHSIAHYILENTPQLKVMYVTSEVFMNELVDAIRSGNLAPSDFREKYRNVDILLIDDIQFIIGRDRTQEEFFHTFNYLYEAKKQIVISSDKHPKNFNNLDERLKSRFECGLTVDLVSPDFDTKMAILKKKLEIKNREGSNIEVNNDVLAYIAQNITTNIRSLEGALTKVIAMSRMKRIPIDMELAQDALRDSIFPNQKKTITPEFIIEVVAEHFQLSVSDLLSDKRDKYISVPRQIAMYLSQKYTQQSTTAIAQSFKRDHSTVIHGRDAIEAKLSKDSVLENNINTIIRKLNIE